MMTMDFQRTLASIGLEEYYDMFVREAITSWDVLCAVTEDDLVALGVRLGHRRNLQRLMNEERATQNKSLSITIRDSGAAEAERKRSILSKRKYNRHPKDDDNAPPKPPTGYVLFSNHIRAQHRSQKFDFPEMAKLVGREWQALHREEREAYLEKAKILKATYTQQLAYYKQTPQYQAYQAYLTDFRSKKRASRKASDEDAGQRLYESGCCVDCRSSTSPVSEMSFVSTMPISTQGQSIQSMHHPRVMEPVLVPNPGYTRLQHPTALPTIMTQLSSPSHMQDVTAGNMNSRRLPPLIASHQG